MIKVIAVDFGGVYFTYNHERFVKRLVQVTGADKVLVAKAYGRKIRDLHVNKLSERTFWKYVCKTIGKDLSYEFLIKNVSGQSKPVKPMVNLVKKLRKAYRMILFTNNTVALDRADKKYGIYKNFDVVLSSHKVRMQKPYRNMYKLLIKKAGCNPGEILLIDDRERNMKPARKLGIKTILFKNVAQLKKDLSKYEIKIK